MLFNRINRNINHFTLINICAIYLLASIVSGHRCYICGSEGNVTSCDNFDPSNEKFSKECPENDMGCSIQKYDTYIVRSCEEIKINDCKKANFVQYCYCSMDLCNGIEMNYEAKTNLSYDDEDMAEGSGNNRVAEETSTTSKTRTDPESTSMGIMLQSTFMLIMASIMI